MILFFSLFFCLFFCLFLLFVIQKRLVLYKNDRYTKKRGGGKEVIILINNSNKRNQPKDKLANESSDSISCCTPSAHPAHCANGGEHGQGDPLRVPPGLGMGLLPREGPCGIPMEGALGTCLSPRVFGAQGGDSGVSEPPEHHIVPTQVTI